MEHVIVCSEDLNNVGDLALMLQCAHGCRSYLGSTGIQVRQWGQPSAEIVAQLTAAGVGVTLAKSVAGTFVPPRGGLVVVGGGQMVRDNASVPDLLAMLLTMEMARARGGASALLGCGVGKLTRPAHRALWRRMLSHAALVTTRDRSSGDAVRDLCGDRAVAIVTADLAFLPSPLHDALAQVSDDEPFGIVAPCEAADENRHVDVAALARSTIDAATRSGLNRIRFVSHDSRPGMDGAVCLALIEVLRTEAPHIETTHLASRELSDYTRAYAGARFVITNRLHAAIFGMLAGAAVVILDDGGAKTLAAAERFDLLIGPATAPFDTALLERLADASGARLFPARAAALEKAKADAISNFVMLDQRLSAA